MGGGPEHDELLITLPFPSAAFCADDLKSLYPDININYVQVASDKEANEEPKKSELKALYHKATLLITIHILPEDPGDVPKQVPAASFPVLLRVLCMNGAANPRPGPFGFAEFACGTMTDYIFSCVALSSYISHLRAWISWSILLSTASSKIPITTSSGIHGPPIAEWVLASVLGLTRRSFITHKWQEQRHWGKPQEIPGGMSGMGDWHGKTVGVAGYGGIGRHVARVFHALGASIHAYTASPRSTPEARRHSGYFLPNTGDPDGTLPAAWYSGTSPEALHGFLRSGLDLCVIALPLTKKTERLFGKTELQRLREGWDAKAGKNGKLGARGAQGQEPILVNIARGKILDQSALIEALEEGTLSGAAVDVTDPEPLPEGDPLWGAKNLVLTPHVSGLGREYFTRSAGVWAENVRRLRAGEHLINEVQRGRGY